MDQFDEYQKLMRYKYGAYSFIFLMVLIMINYFLSLFLEIQWAETKELEFLLLLFIALGYFIVMSVYKGAFFYQKYKPTVYSFVYFLLGLMNIYLSFSPDFLLITDGLVSFNIIMLLSGLIWFLIPAAYFTRVLVEKRRDLNDINDE